MGEEAGGERCFAEEARDALAEEEVKHAAVVARAARVAAAGARTTAVCTCSDRALRCSWHERSPRRCIVRPATRPRRVTLHSDSATCGAGARMRAVDCARPI